MLGNVDGERGLAHGGTRRQHHQIARLQARGHAIEIDKSGRYTGDLILVIAVVEFINTLDDLREQGLNFLKTLGAACALFGNSKDFGFCLIQHLFDFFTLRIECSASDFIRYGDEFAQYTTIAHNFCIATDVGGRRRVLRQRIEISNSTSIFCLGR